MYEDAAELERVFRTECSTPSVPLFEATAENCGTDVSIQGMRLRVPSQPGTYRLRTRVLFKALPQPYDRFVDSELGSEPSRSTIGPS